MNMMSTASNLDAAQSATSIFMEYFRISLALSNSLKKQTFQIRHEVYCRDLEWEPLQYNGIETDKYDSHSMSCLLTRAQTGASVGCLRLVLNNCGRDSEPFPVEVACKSTLDNEVMAEVLSDRNKVAEVSRLAVMRDYRRRKGETEKPIAMAESDFGDNNHTRFPYIPVSLFLSAIAMAENMDIHYLLLLSEPRLASHLQRLGFAITQAGPEVEHRGIRIPSVIETKTTIRNFRSPLPNIWALINKEIEQGFNLEAKPQEFLKVS